MSFPNVFVIGANHHKAPIEVREKLALASHNEDALLTHLRSIEGLHELAVVNTCNRIEFYGVGNSKTIAEEVTAAFCKQQAFEISEFEAFRLSLKGKDAVQHLAEVAAGLDSQILGETEIFGQIKEAYANAQTRKFTGPILNRIFQKIFQAAKHVRSTTKITVGQVSIANVAVELALNIFGQLKETRILLLGAGDIGEKTAKAFQSRGALALTVSNRGFDKALHIATELGASALPFDQKDSRLCDFDVVVCSTSAPECILTKETVLAGMKKRPTRPLFLIDLALPRNVEASVNILQNVFVYNLDDLAKIADENRASREAEIITCKNLLGEKVENLWKHIEPQLISPSTSHVSAKPTPPQESASI